MIDTVRVAGGGKQGAQITISPDDRRKVLAPLIELRAELLRESSWIHF